MIRFIIKLYIFLLLVDALLTFFPETMKYKWRVQLKKLCDKACDPIRRKLPPSLPFDFSHLLIVFSLTIFLEVFLYLW
jgi:uncharacterized protein YggT (Ycf19 family)